MRIAGKQERFIDEYLLDRNATQAAIRAGYSARSAAVQAHHLLRNPNVAREVAQRTAHQVAELKITREQVIKGLVAAYEVAKSQGDAGSMIKAAAELAKMCGFYDPPVGGEAKGVDPGALDEAQSIVAEMTDEELLEMVEG